MRAEGRKGTGDSINPRGTQNLPGNTRKLALGAVSAAFVVATLYLIPVVPTNTISLYALSSFFVAVMIIEVGLFYGWAFYAATSLLALLVVPDKMSVLPYIAFFGFYGLIKYYIEKIKYLPAQYLVKFACFNIALAAAYFVARQLFEQAVSSRLPVAAIAAVLQAIFLVYDYVYTLFIRYYMQKLRRFLKTGR